MSEWTTDWADQTDLASDLIRGYPQDPPDQWAIQLSTEV
jgi:hypothetical protein